MNNESEKNANRFMGFADIYETARPSLPVYPTKIICQYLGRKPENIIDLGCGTGLSSFIWEKLCDKVIGVEPSPDMLKTARKKESDKVKFIQAYSHNIDLPDNWADVIICSQSFHWMEPVSTLKEVNRILKQGGIFAAVDCDWPPVSIWQADKSYDELYKKVKKIESEMPDIAETFVRYKKEDHLKNIKESNYFRYARELLFSNTETCSAQRFINIILSQGSTQTIIKKRPGLIEKDIEIFKENIFEIWKSHNQPIDFSCRMRIAVK